ncbi:MAG: hypothetical protein CSA75_03510, partial [Sorangium cellulosum]
MAARTRLEEGFAILRSIAQSDAFKKMRVRIRDGASHVAESDRIPSIVAGSAGIVAALLTDDDEQDEEPSGEGAETAAPEKPAVMVVPSPSAAEDDADEEDPIVESVAAVRDLDGSAPLDVAPEADDSEKEDELGDDDGVLKFVRQDVGQELGEALKQAEPVKPDVAPNKT